MKYLYSLIFFFIFTISSYSQNCNSYALHHDMNLDVEFFTKLDPITGEITLLDSIEGVHLVQHGFSAIDGDQGYYFFHGIDNNNQGKLYSLSLYDGSIVNSVAFPPANANGNIIEMHYHPYNGLLYALNWDFSSSMEFFVSLNPLTGELIKIDSIPDVKYVQLDYSGINYFNDEFYFIGIDSMNTSRLYTMDMNTGAVLNNPVFPGNNINGGVNELEVDPYSGNLISLHYDQVEMAEYFVRVDPVTGIVTKVSSIPNVQLIQAGFSAVNSSDGQYYFYGIDENNDSKLYTIDIYSGEVLNNISFTTNINGGLKELQFPIIIPPVPSFSQTSICNNDSALITVPSNFASYNWSDGSTGDHIYISDSSSYTLSLTKYYGCQIEINPMPLQVYNCADFTDSLVLVHDTCLFNSDIVAMSYTDHMELDGDQLNIIWNFVSIDSDTIQIPANYEIQDNGLFSVAIGFNCSDKEETSYFYSMINVENMNPTIILESNLEQVIQVFPNPAQDWVQIQTINDNEWLKVELFNINAQEVYSRQFRNTSQAGIDISQYENGIYLIRIQADDTIYTKKILIN